MKKWAMGGFVTGRCLRSWLVAARAFWVDRSWVLRSGPFEIMANNELLHGRVMGIHHGDKPGRESVTGCHLDHFFGVVISHYDFALYLPGLRE